MGWGDTVPNKDTKVPLLWEKLGPVHLSWPWGPEPGWDCAQVLPLHPKWKVLSPKETGAQGSTVRPRSQEVGLTLDPRPPSPKRILNCGARGTSTNALSQ